MPSMDCISAKALFGCARRGACLAVSCKCVELKTGAGDHDKVTVSSLGPEEAYYGALALPRALQTKFCTAPTGHLLTAV